MLNEIVEGLWHVEGDVYVEGWLHFPCRMVVVRLSGGGLLLHSPISLEEGVAEELDQLGKVEVLVAPNCLHHLFLPACIARYPEARVVCAKGLMEKRKDIQFDEELGERGELLWAEDLEQCTVEGVPGINEVVFYHGKTKTLIVTDLFFNMSKWKNWISPWIFRAVGVYKRPAQSRLWRFVTKDREAAGASLRRILDWDLERIVMAHGEIIEEDARGVLERACAWMLGT